MLILEQQLKMVCQNVIFLSPWSIFKIHKVAKYNGNNTPYKVKKNTWTLPYLPWQLLQTLYW